MGKGGQKVGARNFLFIFPLFEMDEIWYDSVLLELLMWRKKDGRE